MRTSRYRKKLQKSRRRRRTIKKTMKKRRIRKKATRKRRGGASPTISTTAVESYGFKNGNSARTEAANYQKKSRYDTTRLDQHAWRSEKKTWRLG